MLVLTDSLETFPFQHLCGVGGTVSLTPVEQTGSHFLSDNQRIGNRLKLLQTNITGAAIFAVQILPEVFDQLSVATAEIYAVTLHGFQ